MIESFFVFIIDKVIVGVITGLIASLIGSLIFFYALSRLKPQIEISDKISKDENPRNGQTRYRIKILNKTKAPIMNINAQFRVFRSYLTRGGQIYQTREIPLKTNNPIAIGGFDLKDQDANYAYRFITYCPLLEEWQDTSVEFLRFRIICTHAISGFGQYFIKDYYLKSDIVDGNFEKGNSLEIRSHQ